MSLPSRKKIPFDSVLNNTHYCDFTVAWRPTPRDGYAELGTLRLTQIRKTKGVDTRMDVVLEMAKTLNESLFVWDTLIRRRVLLEFNIQLHRRYKGLVETMGTRAFRGSLQALF